MPNEQVLRGAPATVSITMFDQYGQPRVGGDVTVTITRADGTVLVSDVDAVSAGGGVFTTELTPTHTSELTTLSAAWTLSGVPFETLIEVVGGYYFSLDEARQAGPNMTDDDKYPAALVIAARRAVEEECERITNRAFVPRSRRVVLSGNDAERLTLPDPDTRVVRSLSVGGVAQSQDVIDRLRFNGAGRLSVGDTGISAWGYFPWGTNNIEVEYEYGLDAPPQRIKSAALLRMRDVMQYTKTNAPDRNSWQIIEGRVFGMTQPGVRGSETGIPEVDKAYGEWAFRRGSAASIPHA